MTICKETDFSFNITCIYMRYIKNRAQTRSLAPLTFLMKTKSEIRKGAKKTTECPKKNAPIKQKWPNMAGLSTFQSGPKGSKSISDKLFFVLIGQ